MKSLPFPGFPDPRVYSSQCCGLDDPRTVAAKIAPDSLVSPKFQLASEFGLIFSGTSG